MSFFAKSGKILYDGKQATNLLNAVLPSRLKIDSSYVYKRYMILDGDTPESIAEELYNDANLHWTLYVVNSIVNPYSEWPMNSTVFDQFVTVKYTGDIYGIHHYFDVNLDRECDDVDSAKYRAMDVSDLPEHIVPVTNYDYESELNDSKRQILIVDKGSINRFVEAYRKAQEGIK